MDELLLENSLFTNQSEYDDIIKDKEKVADIFFINYFGFFSLFKLGLRGDIKRYKSEEASLYPKYIGADNKDVSISVKMLFDARITHGSVTARMTKLLAKVKGNMLEPKDVDNTALKEILNDSKITTAHKPSVKVRQIMQRWLDDEFAIEWLAYYLYKIARLPEYKDITKEFVSMYKTGQYSQAYTNILNGARKKHTGDIPKEFQNNDPTQIANTQTDNAVDSLSDKEKFLAVFKQAIEAEKGKIVADGGVVVKNNSDYAQDEATPQKEEPKEPEIEKIDMSIDQLIDETIVIANGGMTEFVKPTNKEYVYTPVTQLDRFEIGKKIASRLYEAVSNGHVTLNSTGLEKIFESVHNAITQMYSEYQIDFDGGSIIRGVATGVVFKALVIEAINSDDVDYLFKNHFTEIFFYANYTNLAKTQIDASTKPANIGGYLIKLFNAVLSEQIDFDHELLKRSIRICISLFKDMPLYVESSQSGTVAQVLEEYIKECDTSFVTDFVKLMVAYIIVGKITQEELQEAELFDLFDTFGVLEVAPRDVNDSLHYVLDSKWLPLFDSAVMADLIKLGNLPFGDKKFFHFKEDTIPSDGTGNDFINAFESLLNGRVWSTNWQEVSRILYNDNYITIATPNGLSNEDFTYKNIRELTDYYINQDKNNEFNSLFNIGYMTRFIGYARDHKTVEQLKTTNDIAIKNYQLCLSIAMVALKRNGIQALTKGKPLAELNQLNDASNVFAFVSGASYYIREANILPKNDKVYNEILDELYQYLADGITPEYMKQYADEILKGNREYIRLPNGVNTHTGVMNMSDANLLFCELTQYSKLVSDKVTSIIESDKDMINEYFGHKSKFLFHSAKRQNEHLTLPAMSKEIYDLGITQILSGELRLIDASDYLANDLLEKGKLSPEMLNEYLNDVITLLRKDYSTLVNEYSSTQLELLGRIVQTNADCDKDLVKRCLSIIEMQIPQIGSIEDKRNVTGSYNTPFIRSLASPTYSKTISEENDKMTEIIFGNLRQWDSHSGYNPNNVYLVAAMRIKDETLYEKIKARYEYNYSTIKYTSFEIHNVEEFKQIFDPEIFVQMNQLAQKDMLEALIGEINARRKSGWMETEGVTIYVDRLMELFTKYAEVNGDDAIKNLISPARLKTILANSAIHQIDFDKMQLDLNNGIINTPKILGKDMLLKLAQLNGFYNKADFKKEIKIPRGTKPIDIVRHIKGEKKIIDNIDLKLKEIPFDEIDHDEDSIKRVNAQMWKTRTDKHKDYMLIFEKEFRPKEMTNNVDTFLVDNPDSRVLELAFHGTGRIAGAYICRYGFADVRGDVGIGIAGKMLGNGTYVAINYDKSASYVTDRGTNYTAGRHNGYLFTLRVAIGKRGVHHQYARAGNGLLVEEWCIKLPTQQIDILSIFKCHSVTKKEAYNILKDYQ